jgi:hypothetical protein
MPSESYSPISDSEIAVDKPLTASLVARMRDNPLAMLKGSPSARAAGLGVFVQKDIGAGNQNGIQTDNLDTTAVLRPDGAGGVVWSSDTQIFLQVYIVAPNNPSATGRIERNCQMLPTNDTIDPPDVHGNPHPGGYNYGGAFKIRTLVPCAILYLHWTGPSHVFPTRITRKRSGIYDWSTGDMLGSPIVNTLPGDDYFFASSYSFNSGLLLGFSQ